MRNNKRKEENFVPSEFDIVLMSSKDGIIANQFGYSFTYSLLNTDFELKAGKYYFMISPHWNLQALNSQAYQEVLVDILAPE